MTLSAVDRARAVRIEDEAAQRGVKLTGRVELIGPCPNCGGTDRFAINTAKQVFNCRGCQGRGDVISLVMLLDGCSFGEAVDRRNSAPRPPPNMSEPRLKKQLGCG